MTRDFIKKAIVWYKSAEKMQIELLKTMPGSFLLRDKNDIQIQTEKDMIKEHAELAKLNVLIYSKLLEYLDGNTNLTLDDLLLLENKKARDC